MLSSNKPHYHARLPKTNLKILLNYFRETTLTGNVMLQPWSSDCFINQNMIFKIVRYLSKSDAAVRRCLQPFTEKCLFMSIFLIKVAGLQPEKRLQRRCFLVSLPNILELLFCETLLGGDCFY